MALYTEKRPFPYEFHTLSPKLVPEGSTGMWARSGGECVVCGGDYPASRMVMRSLVVGDDGQLTGPKVCKFCSPHVSDEILYRYGEEIDDWDIRWLEHLDSNTQVFDGKVVCVGA